MIGYLQSQDVFRERLIIGPDEGTLVPASEAETKDLPLLGHYSNVSGRRVMLYRWDGTLRLRLGDDAPMEANSIQAEWNCSGDVVTLVLQKEGQEILREVYPLSPDIKSIDDDPTPFVEAEDFDFFLFVRNVLHDPARADRLYRAK